MSQLHADLESYEALKKACGDRRDGFKLEAESGIIDILQRLEDSIQQANGNLDMPRFKQLGLLDEPSLTQETQDNRSLALEERQASEACSSPKARSGVDQMIAMLQREQQTRNTEKVPRQVVWSENKNAGRASSQEELVLSAKSTAGGESQTRVRRLSYD